MNLESIITRELKRAGRGAIVMEVPESRRASSESIARLDAEISYQINENAAMRTRSVAEAARISVK